MKKRYGLACLLLILTTNTAQARFEVDRDFITPAPTATLAMNTPDVLNRNVHYFGVAPSETQPAVGKGVNVPASFAIQQIVPKGWAVDDSKMLGKGKKVTWEGRDDWALALGDVITPLGVKALINWENHTVFLSGGEIEVKPVAVKSLPVPEPTPVPPVAVVAPPVKTYSISPKDETLSKALRRWSKEAHWQLCWESPKDFNITAEATFSGDFKTVIEELVISLAGTEAPVQAVFYKNKVVRIVLRGTKIQ